MLPNSSAKLQPAVKEKSVMDFWGKSTGWVVRNAGAAKARTTVETSPEHTNALVQETTKEVNAYVHLLRSYDRSKLDAK